MGDKIIASVIVLNYYGEKVIESTIRSLVEMNYPQNRLEIIIVDNNSKDKSREIIKRLAGKYSNTQTIFLGKNLGFSKGNNVGIKAARGQYVALLNNDCIVCKNWLSELIKVAESKKDIFAVSSKIKLYPKYHNLKFNYSNGLFLVQSFLNDSYLSELEKSKKLSLDVIKKNGFYLMEIPYSPDDKFISVRITFEVSQQDSLHSSNNSLTVLNQDGVMDIIKRRVGNNRLSVEVVFDVRKFNRKNIFDRIQNAGIVVFQDGSGRDIGGKIIEQRQYYESDYGQYSNENEVYAACGAAVLYNKKILDKLGYLDELFFMYYEDVEISERARLRGYKIYYSPKAEVRHLHAFSSKEWSNFFIYHAEKGRLLHVFFSFPVRVFIREYFIMILRIGEVGLRILKGLSDRRRVLKFIRNIIAYARRSVGSEGRDETDFGKVVQYIRIIMYFCVNLPMLSIKRYIKHGYISDKAITDNYKTIIKGKWYFN